MCNEVDAWRAGLGLQFFDQQQQVLRGPFEAVVLWFLTPRARRYVVEAMDPDAIRPNSHLEIAAGRRRIP